MHARIVGLKIIQPPHHAMIDPTCWKSPEKLLIEDFFCVLCDLCVIFVYPVSNFLSIENP